MGIVLHISTRGRTDALLSTLRGITNYSDISNVYIVDNNDKELSNEFLFQADDALNEIPLIIFRLDNDKRSDAAGCAEAMGVMLDDDIAIKWDDDLIPLPGCLEALVREVEAGAPAAGGLYPQIGEARLVRWSGARAEVPDGNVRHLQLFCWQEPYPDPYPIHHLYSSFAYRVGEARKVGGWCSDYSNHSYRHETDLTLRLSRGAPRLRIVPHALALHHRQPGGTNAIDAKSRQEMITADLALFERRMKERGIDPNY